ncbi:hypothetical protein GALMADRAFT_52954 [Galerina marginata CBS 339.88]|uniref:Uncharacterized protein n=1 Tax=Galerina marginata (strain CBS 339.88) TaxID=685588 RepID=A0A067TPS3_GALM3|nr:hypothetical protein GALMADRAFT_52954 [Galerina marginata CBS 339.88]
MDFVSSPIPQISISPAPPVELPLEPHSPFAALSFNVDGDDGFRPVHLTPPPTVSTFKRPRSPLHRTDQAAVGRGLDTERFQTLLSATKERSAVNLNGGRKGVDLRKEIALKVHKNKQAERRALFLSKVHAPPSPTATITPKTPPDSPAIFHYSLPSPGLVSPLALFESLNEDRDQYSIPHTWIEQVDFRLPVESTKPQKYEKIKPSLGLPSLDQISARLISRSAKPDSVEFPSLILTPAARPRPSVGIGRLRMPLRTQAQPATHTTSSPVQLTEMNLNALNSRDQRAHNMLSTLRRRTLSSECKLTPPSVPPEGIDYKWRRRSAPADLISRPRLGFEHPVLALPGGF